MFREIEPTPEEEEELIRKVAEKVHQYGMDVAAILFLESVKPLAYIGGQMSRVFVAPFLPALGETISMGGEKFIAVFEKRENMEKLLQLVEKMAQEEDESKKKEKAAKSAEGAEKPAKRGWRRFLPF